MLGILTYKSLKVWATCAKPVALRYFKQKLLQQHRGQEKEENLVCNSLNIILKKS